VRSVPTICIGRVHRFLYRWLAVQACTPCTRAPPYLCAVHPISARPMHSCLASVEGRFAQVLVALRARVGLIHSIRTVHLPFAGAVV